MNGSPTQGKLFRETFTQKQQDKFQWINTRLETTYINTYNFPILLIYYNFYYLNLI